LEAEGGEAAEAEWIRQGRVRAGAGPTPGRGSAEVRLGSGL